MPTLSAIWKWEEQRRLFTLHCTAPVVRTSSVQRNANLFDACGILVTALLFPAEMAIKSWWPRNLESGSSLLLMVSGQYCEGSILDASLFGVQKGERSCCQFSAQCVLFRPCHAVSAAVRRSWASSLQLYWMPWKRWTSLSTAFYSTLYSSFLK